MENYIKSCLQGEILIPLENIYNSEYHSDIYNPHKNKININNNKLILKNILNYDYKSFRSIVFKNEFIHFYLIVHFEEEENNNINTKKFSLNINELSDYIQNNCSINIQYSKVYEETKENEETKESENNNNNEDISFTFEENKNIKYINNGILVKNEILEDKNIIIYELYSKIKLKEGNSNNINNKNIEMNITITTNKNHNSYSNLDINDIHIINYLNIYENENNLVKKYILLNINKILSVTNPLNILRIGQVGCGNNKYLLSLKIENITYKINFLDKSLKNSIFLKKNNIPSDEFLYNEFSITITDIYINGDKTSIEDLIFINFLKFEQERKINEKYEINSKKLKFNLINHKFPITIKPQEIFNLLINIEKQYDYLMISDNLSKKDKKNNQINQLANLTLRTPICLNILSNKPINNLIWSFSIKWKDEFNNKLNIYFKIENGDTNYNNGIKLYHFFKVFFIISKLHKEKVKFEFRFNNSYDEFNLDVNLIREKKSAIGDGLPDIFPEKKMIPVEMKENEFSKIIEMRYIPVRTEYIELPPFEIFDCLLNKMYFVFFTTKIYVNK